VGQDTNFKAEKVAPLFAALGDSTRLDLLVRLSRGGPGSIAELAAEAEVSRQAVTKHLKVLADAGYVRGVRRGREHIWRLQPRRFEEAQACLARLSREWDVALGRLKDFVER
jgi:DNA-binding transcriptional ArsR family regulator